MDPKERDGPWSNPGHTWDSSWHKSKRHGTTYGLEVDPWTAVEPVPYLCAVSLNSSCEEFSEPKHMSRGTLTKTSQFGSPEDFAQLDKFSIFAQDDNEFNGKFCASQGFSVNNGDTVMNELRNASQPRRQKFPVTKDPVHRSWALIKCDIFHLCTRCICYSVSTALAYTSAGLNLDTGSMSRLLHISLITASYTAPYTAVLNPQWYRKQVTALFC